MAGPKRRVTNAETEAAEWHSRLGERSVATQTIKDFFAWRESPENADAYRRVELAWGQTRKLADEPQMIAALDETLTRAARKRAKPRRVVAALVAVTAAAALAIGGWFWFGDGAVFSTSVGEQRVIQLADGSSIRLDTDSRVRVRFDHDRRRVDLENGQALFTVAHDTQRPFVVHAGDAQVTAVGTVFDVRRLGDGANVTLVSGIVEVAGGGKAQRMSAGNRALVTDRGTRTAPVDVVAETSWTESRIVFQDRPLREAVAEVNRYLTAKIELDADAKGGEPVNGVFKTGDRDAFVSTASEVFGLRVSDGPNGSVRLSERGK